MVELTNRQLVRPAPLLLLSSPDHCTCEGDKIIVVVSLANFTGGSLTINKRFQIIFDHKYHEAYELRFTITGPDGMTVEPLDFIEDRLLPYPRVK